MTNSDLDAFLETLTMGMDISTESFDIRTRNDMLIFINKHKINVDTTSDAVFATMRRIARANDVPLIDGNDIMEQIGLLLRNENIGNYKQLKSKHRQYLSIQVYDYISKHLISLRFRIH